MDAHWTKEAIHFMRERRSEFSGQGEVLTLIHKPFLAIDLTLAPTPGDPTVDGDTHTQDFAHRFPRAAHWYPSIPALGIMFLEIDLGEGIEGHRSSESLDQNGGLMGNSDHITAGTVIWSPSWENCRIFQAVKEIIDMCLKGHKGQIGRDKNMVRDRIYTWIVAPLGNLFREAWSREQDPDGYMPHVVTFKNDELPVLATTDFGLTTMSSIAHRPSEGVLESFIVEQTSVDHAGKLLGNEASTGERQHRQQETDKWFKNFQLLLVKHNLLRKPKGQRLRVAILDTGVALDQSIFTDEDRDRMKEYACFTGGDAKKDPNGHGTHIAAIILRLTKNCDLYIAKITEDPMVVQRERVAQAIKYARDTWNVHIISMSFGFSTAFAPDLMGFEITNCLRDDIMLFASASNDGGEGSRTYPAMYKDVMSIHSANWRGEKSGFNPERYGQDNFSTVGECIRPVWDPSNTTESQSCLQYRDGTLYATTVAVAIPAFMIAYIRKTMPETEEHQ